MAERAVAAAAFFVRTPGHSTPKSRLSNQVGQEAATALYRLSVACCLELAREMRAAGVEVWWAVAEESAVNDGRWLASGLPAMHSGHGGIGSRLAHVHGRLLERGRVGIMLGSDSPQLVAGRLAGAWAGQEAPVIGPAIDGGFYLFAAGRSLPRELWEKVSYSTSTTRSQLEGQLDDAPVHLATEPDFDDRDSLAQVVAAMPAAPTPAQQAFVDRARQVLHGKPADGTGSARGRAGEEHVVGG